MLSSWKESISQLVFESLLSTANSKELLQKEELPLIETIRNSISRPRDSENGDISSNIAFQISKINRTTPIEVATQIEETINKLINNKLINKNKENFNNNNITVSKIQAVAPGFVNFWLFPSTKLEVVSQIFSDKHFGCQRAKIPQKIILEFVSANPTGPLHVGHARQAVLGDAISKILEASGENVHKEFYYNDAGNQIENLMLSVKARIEKVLPSDPQFPKDGYRGDYINDICSEFTENKITSSNREDSAANIKKFSIDYLRKEQNVDLTALGVHFGSFKLESSFYANGEIEKIITKLENNNKIYKKESAIWFKSSLYGDDKDRVMKKADGNYTYFVPDIAYHLDKWKRGFTRAINIQGFDHHGTLKRVSAGLQALNEGVDKGFPETILHKMVKVIKDGKEVKISKRSGSFITLRDLLCWAGNIKNNAEFLQITNKDAEFSKLTQGRDVVRFFLISKKAETEFTFNVNVAQKQNDENPVFYVQYAYARACSLINQASTNQEELMEYYKTLSSKNLSEIAELLNSPKESLLCMRLAEFPTIFKTALTDLSPHVITFYLKDLASDFHSYYNDTKINVENQIQRKARLLLVLATLILIKKCLTLLGITAPKKM